MKDNLLYLPLSKKETWVCALGGAAYLAVRFLTDPRQMGLALLLTLCITAAVLVFTRDFWQQTMLNATLIGKKIWAKPLLAALLLPVICTAAYDILLLYGLPYFVNSQWGPVLWDVQAALLARQDLYWPIAIGYVLVLPVMEELLFRQLIFSAVYPKSRTLAMLLSVFLYAGFQFALLSTVTDSTYLLIYAFRYLPMGLFLYWLYHSNDSILSPILMHALCNAMTVFTAWDYLN